MGIQRHARLALKAGLRSICLAVFGREKCKECPCFLTVATDNFTGMSFVYGIVGKTQDMEELDDILVWSPKSEILKRAGATSGMAAPLVNET